MTTGLLDAAHLSQALIAVIAHGADVDQMLDDYAKARPSIWRNFTDPMSTEKLMRLASTRFEHVEERKIFFRRLNDPTDIAVKIQEGTADSKLASSILFTVDL